MADEATWPGPADVSYFAEAQARGWGETLRGFARFLGPLDGRRVLDVGSGPGLLPRLCVDAGARLAVAADESWPMVCKAAELGRDITGVPVLAAAATCLPVAGGTFDVVTATNLLFLLANPMAGLAELVRATRSGGVVAVLNPTADMSVAAATAFADGRGLQDFARFSFINYGRLAETHNRISRDGWLALAASAGLGDVRSETRAGGLVLFLGGVVG